MALFPAMYALARRVGWTDKGWFRAAFPRAYFTYKRWVEDPFHGLIARRPELFRTGHIVDVGANIGYNAVLFARALAPGFRVYAFEPDTDNFALLERMTAGLPVRATAAAVGAADGEVELWRNLDHHADHRVATAAWKAAHPEATARVPVVRLDTAVAGQGPIAFVKIDVQGYEPEVLAGMGAVIAANPDLVVALEYAPDGLRELGHEPARVFDALPGFHRHVLHKDGRLAPAAMLDRVVARRGYADVVCARRPLA
jgi:FkbM family methyltransferase